MMIVGAAIVSALATVDPGRAAENNQGSFTLAPDQYGMVLKTPDGRTVFRYMTRKPVPTELTANSVCCLFPLNTPSGEGMVDFAPSDHRHHRGVFMTWHSMHGKQAADFWGWGEFAPTKGRVIVNRGVELVRADAEHAELAVRNEWLADDEVMIREALSIAAREAKGAYVIDLDFRLTPTSDITLRETAFSGLCVKARKEGKAVYSDPKGEVKLPSPHYLKPETDWPNADWYDYTIALNSGKTIGIAVLDHPGNPPTAWFNVAAIGIFNPCIVAPGPVTIKQGQPLRLRYRLVVHDGAAPAGLLAALAREWRGPSAEVFRPEPGFVRLDNGKDLAGWYGSHWSGQPTGSDKGWSVVDGAIHLDVNAARCHLFNKRTFSPNAIIRLQFRATKAADSGLCVHGEQFQVRDYIYSLPDTQRYAFACNPPGEWNDLELDLTRGVARVKLNGKVIEEAWRAGSALQVGLGLQREKGDFDFRYIRIKEK